jgi:hypothetical protein
MTTRRLAAILAADMVDCSRLMGADNGVQQPPGVADRAARRVQQDRHAVAAKWLQNSLPAMLTR